MIGTFRRTIKIRDNTAAHGQEVRGVLEDDFHHFRVAIRHDGATVTAIDAWAVRHPYSLCPAATRPLRRLIGMPLNRVAHSVTRFTDSAHQCTHMFELAGLMIAAAARGDSFRSYRIEVPARVDGHTVATLYRDNVKDIEWHVDGVYVTGPEPYVGMNLRAGMARWAIQTLGSGEAESALVLRRAVVISLGREKALDSQRHAAATGACFVQQPHRAEYALRMTGSTWDFTTRPQAMGLTNAEWEAAEDARFWQAMDS